MIELPYSTIFFVSHNYDKKIGNIFSFGDFPVFWLSESLSQIIGDTELNSKEEKSELEEKGESGERYLCIITLLMSMLTREFLKYGGLGVFTRLPL